MDAVKRFQGRHARERDGVIGPGTIEALNVPWGTPSVMALDEGSEKGSGLIMAP